LFLFRAFFRQISALEILSAKLDIMSHYHRHEAESRLFINQGTAEQSVASRQDTFKAGGRDVRYTETVFSNEEQRGLWRKTLDYSWSIGSKTVHVKYEFLYAEPVAGKT